MSYSIEPRYRICLKEYGFLSFAKNMDKNLSNKYSQKLLDTAKKSTKDAIKTAIQKTAEATVDLMGNKIADKINKIKLQSLKSTHNSLAINSIIFIDMVFSHSLNAIQTH